MNLMNDFDLVGTICWKFILHSFSMSYVEIKDFTETLDQERSFEGKAGISFTLSINNIWIIFSYF